MTYFLLIFFGIYGGLNAYCYWKLQAALPPRPGWRLALAAFLTLMVFAPILIRMLDRRGAAWLAVPLAYVGYLWMVVWMWLVFYGLGVDLWNLAAGLAARWRPGLGRLVLGPRPAMAAFGVLCAVLLLWGAIGARAVRLREVEIECPGLAPGSQPVRMVQITDVHMGPLVGARRLARMLALVRKARPDLVVSTGDLPDSEYRQMRDAARMLADLDDVPLGKFAVTGNHDYYLGLDKSLRFHREAGFRMLRGESVMVRPDLRLAGVDDPAGLRTGQDCRLDEDAVLPAARDAACTILLKHQPVVRQASVGRFDLQVSGHTHGGQVFPFTLIVNRLWRYARGRRDLGKGSTIYVSLGAGTWGPPLRLLAPAEVTRIILRPPAVTAQAVLSVGG